MSEIPQPSSRERKAQKLDWRALAEVLDREGKHELAAEVRASGESAEANSKHAEILSNEQFMAQRKKELDQEVEAARNIPRPVHNPRFDARRLTTNTIDAIKKMLKPSAGQNKPSSVPNAPKGPTPSGGK